MRDVILNLGIRWLPAVNAFSLSCVSQEWHHFLAAKHDNGSSILVKHTKINVFMNLIQVMRLLFPNRGHFEFDLEGILIYFDILFESDREMFEFASRPGPIGQSESTCYCTGGPLLGMNILVNIIGLSL